MSVIGKITASYLLEKCPTYAEERRLLWPTSDQFEDKLNMGDTDECNNVIHKMTAAYLLGKVSYLCREKTILAHVRSI